MRARRVRRSPVLAPALAPLLLVACAAPAGEEAPAAGVGPAAPASDPPAPAASAAPPSPYRAPEVVADPAAVGVGAGLPLDLVWQGVGGEAGTLGQLLAGAPAAVVVLTSLECPLTRLYAPHLRERLAPWRARGVRVLVLDPIPQDDPAALRALAARLEWDWPVAHDPQGRWATALLAERTTDTFLVDAGGVLRYRGALDDQYGIGYRRPAPRRTFLADALEAVLAGGEPAVPATRAPGCLLPAR